MAKKSRTFKNKGIGSLIAARRLAFQRWSPHMVEVARIRGSVRGLAAYSQTAGIVVVPARPRPVYVLLDTENDEAVPITAAEAFRRAGSLELKRRPPVKEVPWDALIGLITGTFQFPEEAHKTIRELLPFFPTQRFARLGLKKAGLPEAPFKKVIKKLPTRPRLTRK
jgi:hypothetical protein